jgi:hypothetical protein
MSGRERIIVALQAGCDTIAEVAAHTLLPPDVVVRELFFLVRDGQATVTDEDGEPVFTTGARAERAVPRPGPADTPAWVSSGRHG